MIEAMLSSAALGSIPESIQGAVASELIMQLGAAELVFPYAQATEYAQRAIDGKLTDFHIANIFKIPTVYVERLTSRRMLEVWGEIRQSAQ